MRLRLSLPSLALLTLATACGDDPAAGVTASSTLASATDTSGSSDASSGEGSSEGAPATTGESTSESASGDPSTTAAEGESGSSTGDESESDGTDTTDTTGDDTATTGDDMLPPSCDPDTPPKDFDAKPKAPTNDATVAGPKVDLTVAVSGEDLGEPTAKFYLREIHELTSDDDFTIIVLPDTQNYTQFPGNFPLYQAQTQWIWDHRNTDNIVAVLHNGDIVQHGNSEEIEWKRAETAMKTIESEVPNFPDGLPYGLAVGNHDNGAYAHDDKPFATTFFNKYFGVARFKDRAYYGGHYGSNNDDSWLMVRAGNLDVLMVNFEYRGALGQDPEVLEWAKGVFKDHPNALGIVNSHYIVKANGDFGAQGKAIYNAMKTVDNVQLMTSGHIKHTRARRVDDFNGHKIHSMLADYQDLIIAADKCAGGCGYLRIWRFSPKKNQLAVETYSPSLKKSMIGPQERFTLTVDLSAATGVFEVAGSTSGADPTLTYQVKGLEPGATYEWYALVKACGVKVTTAKRSFTVK